MPRADRNSRGPGGRLIRCGRLTCVAAAAFVLLPGDGFAGRHDRGTMTLSLGGSVAQKSNYRDEKSVSYEWDGSTLIKKETPTDDRYSDIDLTVSPSVGYFVADRTELGVCGSSMNIWYSDTNHSDFGVHDAKLYAKYYFDNQTALTPYVKVEGGACWISSGDYSETDMRAGVIAGIEYFGRGNVALFAELSSEYTKLSDGVEGSQWENQVYLGVSVYLDFVSHRTSGSTAAAAASLPARTTLTPEALEKIEDADRRWQRALEQLDLKIDKDYGQAQDPPAPAK